MDSNTVYIAFACLIISVSVVILVRIYRSMFKPYEGFPTNYYTYHLLKIILFGGLPNNVPATSFMLQYKNGLNKVSEKEGFFYYWFVYHCLVVCSADAAKFFLTEPAAVEKAKIYDMMHFLLGNGLVTSDSKTWARHRKIINPTFHRMQYKNFGAVFNRNSAKLVQELRAECEKPAVDIASILARNLFKSTLETVIGIKEDHFRVSGVPFEEFFEATTEVLDFIINRFLSPWLYFEFLWPFLPGGSRIKLRAKLCHKFPQQVIKEMLNSTEEIEQYDKDNYDYSSTKCKPLARSFLEAHRADPKGFTLEDVQNELMTIMSAGFHTVKAAAVWTIFLLGLHPEIQEEAFKEVCSKRTSELSHEELQSMPYLESVIKETLRLYPAVPLVARRLEKDVQFRGRTVPKGTQVYINIYMLHRDPDVFPNPEVFDPCRFAPEKKGQISRFHYMPFLEGPRACIGKRFAMSELQAVLAHVIRNFKIVSLDARDKINMKCNIALSPVEMPRITLIPRGNEQLALF